MAEDLSSSISYLCRKKSSPGPLSFTALRYLLYLIHWKHVLVYDRDMTGAIWIFTRRGPESGLVFDALFSSQLIEIVDYERLDGDFGIMSRRDEPEVSQDVKRVLDFVLSKEAKYSESELQRLVYSTHPMLTTPRFNRLNLTMKAKEYIEFLRTSGTSEDEIRGIRSLDLR